jgi:hypothetical protein
MDGSINAGTRLDEALTLLGYSVIEGPSDGVFKVATPDGCDAGELERLLGVPPRAASHPLRVQPAHLRRGALRPLSARVHRRLRRVRLRDLQRLECPEE